MLSPVLPLLRPLLGALIGLVVGGVINLLADDLPQRMRPRQPRCIDCRHPYAPPAWLALGQRFLGGGRCPNCGLPTRRRALLVEVGMAALFAALPLLIERPVTRIFAALYVTILILIIVTDLEHRLILHAVTVPGTLLALLGSLFIPGLNLALAGLGAVTGFVIFFAFFWLGRALFGPGALGFGDVTLSTMMGAMVGFPQIFLALIGGIMLAGLVTFTLLLAGMLSMRSTVAYGPFLAIAGILTILWGEPFLDWYFS
ncbi:MAG: A24 family peptidase [Candidatus Promineifilaceae bacterium]|nr:A24 family peptidase [Candidatus Promineifilaceae bacterium]